MRYSLRTLLILVTVVCIVAGYFLNRAHVESAARDRLRKSGFVVAYRPWAEIGPTLFLGQSGLIFENTVGPTWLRKIGGGCLTDHIRFVDGQRSARQKGDGEGLHDSDLAPLEGLHYVHCLYLGFNPITDEGLQHISHMQSLRRLGLAGTNITDRGLEHLAGLKNLEEIVLEFTSISDEGLAHLSRLPKLNSIALMNTKVRGPGLADLGRLRHLEDLSLPGCKIESRHLKPLAACARLRKLSLDNCGIDDEAGHYLARMQNLEELGLERNSVTDQCMKMIATLPHLRRLDIAYTPITEKSIPVFQSMLTVESVWASGCQMSEDSIDSLLDLDKNRASDDRKGTPTTQAVKHHR